MKYKKLLGALLVASTLILGACGGNDSSASGKSSGKSNSGSKSTPTSVKPAEPTKTVSLTAATLAKGTDNKVYLTINGTYDLYNAGEIKLAWAVRAASGTSDAFSDAYAYGSAEPGDADFKADGVTMDATKKTFEAKLTLTDLTIASGTYGFAVGTKEDTGFAFDAETKIELSYEFGNIQDSVYRYYPRDDVNAVAIEALPPVTYSSASIVELAAAKGNIPAGRYLKVGGPKSAAVTAEVAAAWSPRINFEPVPYSSATQINMSGDNQNGFYEIDGDNFYWYLDVTGLRQGTNYLVHLNENGNTNVNLFMTAKMEDTPYRFESDNVIYTLYANPAAGQAGGADEFYGCLAVKVSYVNEPEPAE